LIKTMGVLVYREEVIRATPADGVKFEPVFCVCRPARAI